MNPPFSLAREQEEIAFVNVGGARDHVQDGHLADTDSDSSRVSDKVENEHLFDTSINNISLTDIQELAADDDSYSGSPTSVSSTASTAAPRLQVLAGQ